MSAIDEEADISMVYSFAEEETKEHEIKISASLDEYTSTSGYLHERVFSKLISAKYHTVVFSTILYHPGIIVPPPEFS
ncbi:hypothetical protein [Algoriphagus ratkowskyi]|uniref:Uncharacterized protein n=1 Tax=Algoriphagus ratkowskyi TaxID=57028 RepID=A0ABY3HMB6_9BACT|nr:hypothetical protein [Algoriphagus ratkowskyi]TXD77254.1 hypothetical protein ESW18_13245 [Algoriphagus ratkowskyi]